MISFKVFFWRVHWEFWLDDVWIVLFLLLCFCACPDTVCRRLIIMRMLMLITIVMLVLLLLMIKMVVLTTLWMILLMMVILQAVACQLVKSRCVAFRSTSEKPAAYLAGKQAQSAAGIEALAALPRSAMLFHCQAHCAV